MTAVSSEIFAQPRARTGMPTLAPALALAAIGSIGAGAIHAAAIGVHSEHRQAVIAFTILAIAQLGWGVLALQRPGRLVVLAGAAINLAAVVGWVMAKSGGGISFIDGLDVEEGRQFADTTAAVLAAIVVIAALAALVWHNVQSWFGPVAFTGTALATAVLAAFAMVSAGSHVHAHGAAGHTDTAGAAHSHPSGTGSPQGSGHTNVVVPPKPYDPTKPIDLGGVPGVTPEQQARAENLIAITLVRLPKYSDYRVAERDGFVSIGDGFTGDEHFVKQSYFNDGHILDPDYPESLVYKNHNGTRTLAAAMYMMAPGTKFSQIPDVGGSLTQWHIHDNLCFTTDAKVASLTKPDGTCDPPLVKVVDSPMIHVWIQKHPCGPFAALEGIGGGTIPEGETRLCDHAHGA
jgi:hypothetical protein